MLKGYHKFTVVVTEKQSIKPSRKKIYFNIYVYILHSTLLSYNIAIYHIWQSRVVHTLTPISKTKFGTTNSNFTHTAIHIL